MFSKYSTKLANEQIQPPTSSRELGQAPWPGIQGQEPPQAQGQPALQSITVSVLGAGCAQRAKLALEAHASPTVLLALCARTHLITWVQSRASESSILRRHQNVEAHLLAPPQRQPQFREMEGGEGRNDTQQFL